MEQKREEVLFRIGILFLAIMSTAFLGIGEKYILLVLFLLCVVQMLLNKRFHLDKEALLLLAGMFLYSIVVGGKIFWMIKVTLFPFLFYVYGKAISTAQQKDKAEYKTKTTIIVLSGGFLAGAILNAASYYKYGFEDGRAWKEFWSGQRLPATQHIFWSLLITALVFYGILYWKQARLINGILILGGLWSVWFSLVTGSRGLVVIFGIVFLINLILYCCFNWHNEDKKGHIKKTFIAILIICTLGVVTCLLNIGGFSDFLKLTMWGRNGGILHNVRFEAQIAVLKQLFKYPFGGKQMDLAGLNYAHNVWLDMANDAGALPFVLVVLYTVLTIYNLVKLIKNQDIGQEIKYILLSAYTSLFLYYMIEPALDANIIFWSIWMLVCGLVKGNLLDKKISTKVIE